MVLLVDYLEEEAQKIHGEYEKLRDLNKLYDKTYDRDIREEIDRLKKSILKKKAAVSNELYRRIRELQFIKKYFPELFNFLTEDEHIGDIIKKKCWLLDFRTMKREECEVEILRIKNKRKQIRDALKFLKKWTGKIDSKSLVATWPVLKEKLNGSSYYKEEIEEKIMDLDKSLRRNGWLIFINDPYIYSHLNRFFDMLKALTFERMEKEKKVEKTKGLGTLAEDLAEKELGKINKKIRKLEKKCRHLLMANPEFLQKLKSQKTVWREKSANDFMDKFVSNIEIPKVNEIQWLNEMRKRLDEGE